jgi:hypothetical protein
MRGDVLDRWVPVGGLLLNAAMKHVQWTSEVSCITYVSRIWFCLYQSLHSGYVCMINGMVSSSRVSIFVFPLTLLSVLRLRRHPYSHLQSQVSPPVSPSVEQKTREPYPVPSSNPSSQYTLLEKLGTGSFGTVHKAVHNETKQIVAIKQIGIS